MSVQENSKKIGMFQARDVLMVGSTLLVFALLYVLLWGRDSATPSNAQSRIIDPMIAAHGQQLYLRSCANCHGQQAQGLPKQGVDLRSSRMIAEGGDPELLEFLRVGRLPNDPMSVTGLYMPPKGGNMSLNDDNLSAIVAYLRSVQQQHRAGHRADATAPATQATVN